MKNSKILFKEKQRFRRWWLWIIFLGADFIFISGSYMQLVIGLPFGNKPLRDTTLLIITGLLVLLTLLYIFMCFTTLITKNGIYLRFFPFQWDFEYFAWSSITKCTLTRYVTSAQLAGVGLRFGLLSHKTAYNIAGNKGVFLKFSDRKPVFIGTKRPQDLADILKALEQIKK